MNLIVLETILIMSYIKTSYRNDFYCQKFKLIIEVDGGIHNSEIQSEHDENRTFELEDFGIQVIRFSNEEILNNLESVLQKIHQTILRSSSPSPGGEGAGR